MKNSYFDKIKDLVFQYGIVNVRDIEFSEDVVSACKQNYCGNYNTRWTCPPAVGSLEDLKRTYSSYDSALVFTSKHELEDSFDFEGMMNGMLVHNNIQADVVSTLNLDEYKILGAGACKLCEKCTYPDSPCRFPHKVIVSVEACGINVVDLAKTADINYHNGEKTVTYFSVLFYR